MAAINGKDISGLNSPRAPLACRMICTSSETFSQNLDLRENKNNDRVCKVNRLLVSSVGRAPVCCAEGRGFEPQTGPTLRGECAAFVNSSANG